MSNLKELRNRLKSIHSTKKITSAMKIVATAKFRHLKIKVGDLASYAQKMSDLAGYAAGCNDKTMDKTPLLLNGGIGATLVISFTSDRGLCGAFNSNVAKETLKVLKDLNKNSQAYRVMILGQKGKNILANEWNNYGLSIIEQITTMDDAKALAQQLVDLLEAKIIGKIILVKGSFRSILHQPVIAQTLVPIQFIQHKDMPIMEPSPLELLPQILQHNLAVQLYYAFWDSQICEQASRMASMDNATRNAKDMINKLQLIYNYSRQAQITNELVEILSGSR